MRGQNERDGRLKGLFENEAVASTLGSLENRPARTVSADCYQVRNYSLADADAKRAKRATLDDFMIATNASECHALTSHPVT